MKKLIFTIFATVMLALTSPSADGQNNIWSLPPSYKEGNIIKLLPIPQYDWDGITLNQPNFPSDGYDGQISGGCHNAMQDKDGNLLFFIVDGFVYDNLGRYIGDIDFSYQAFGRTEILIVPDPSDCDKYYLFAEGIFLNNSFTTTVHYIVLDLTPDYLSPGPYFPTLLGSSQPLMTNIKNYYNTIAATKINNGGRFVFLENGGRLYRYKLDVNGLILENTYVYSNASMTWDQGIRAEMEIIETLNNANQPVYKIAFAYHGSGPKNIVYMAELDITTGSVISGTEEYKEYYESGSQDPLVHGLEFSPDGKTLYITHEKTALYPSGIDYYTLGSGSAPQSLNITTDADFQFSQIELGKDGKLYFATNNRLATLDQSNTPLLSIWNNSSLSISYNENYAFITTASTGAYGTKTFILPDQIDGMDYAEHFTANLECCIANTTFTTGTDNINYQQYGVQTWNNGNANPFATDVITVKDELVIKSGASIVANNLRFEFAPDAKLVIETGATFTVNNCTLTVETTCENTPMWNGVDVMGSVNGQQTGAGKFIANNSLIEHSYWAVHNFKTQAGVLAEEYGPGYRGGVIQATNTTFRNNHRAMVFFDFQNKNALGNAIDDQSRFTNCIFVTDDQLNKPSLTPTVIMAHLFGVQSVNFYGCDFKNTASLATIPYLDRGLGIGADNCLLTVTSRVVPGSLTPDRSSFTDLLRGIEAYSSLGSARTTKVVNTDFNNNWRGIYLKTNNLAIITSNYFDVGEFASPTIGSYGLYLDNCDKYKVENNNFNSIPTHSGYVGLYVQNSGTGNNEIYRNNFNNLLIGTQTAGINGALGEGGGTGLEFRCNTYTNIYGMDIVISNNRIKPTHGNCVTMFGPSNNQFSRTTLYGDFYQNNSVTSHVTYQYSQPNSFTIDPIQFNTINTFPTVCSAYVFDPTTSCPVRLTKGQFLLKDEYAAAKQQVVTLTAQIDEGNTKGLLAIVQTQSPGNVLNALIEASPYLSDEVLLAYLATNPPNGNLQQVLTENSPLSEQVMAAVQKLNLPKGIKTIVNNVQTGTSAMQELQTEIAYYKNEADQLKNDILRYFLFDDAVEERLKEAIEFLNEGVECTKRQCDLVEFYTANKEYAKATQELSVLTDNIEDADYVKLFTNIIELEQTADPVQELATNPIKQQPIIEVAESPVRKQESAMAEVMLKRAKLRNYQETIEDLIVGGSGLRLMNEEEQKTLNSKLSTSNSITVYPNPTSGEVNITHNLSIENGKVTFKVYSMLGVEVLNENLSSTNNEVKINNLKSGVYFYTITQNNQTIKTDKLMVR